MSSGETWREKTSGDWSECNEVEEGKGTVTLYSIDFGLS